MMTRRECCYTTFYGKTKAYHGDTVVSCHHRLCIRNGCCSLFPWQQLKQYKWCCFNICFHLNFVGSCHDDIFVWMFKLKIVLVFIVFKITNKETKHQCHLFNYEWILILVYDFKVLSQLWFLKPITTTFTVNSLTMQLCMFLVIWRTSLERFVLFTTVCLH